jgi:hypothetical protein
LIGWVVEYENIVGMNIQGQTEREREKDKENKTALG